MLNKRLVDYSSSEDEEDLGLMPAAKAKPILEANKSLPQKKLIRYDKVAANNPFNNINTAIAAYKVSDELREALAEGADKDKNLRKIEFETVVGKKEFHLEAPKEKLFKRKSIREPFYYTTMKEIYAGKIQEAEQEQATRQEELYNTVDESEIGKEEIPEHLKAKSGYKDISQKDLINFDYGRYLEEKERKDALVQERMQNLAVGQADPNHAQIASKARMMIEKEAMAETNRNEKQEVFYRNKKQYGF